MEITKPDTTEYEGHFGLYINTVTANDLLPVLKNDSDAFGDFIFSIPPSKLDYRYVEGKWTIKEIITHLTDAERIFVYRALRFARNDQTELPGFEENDYVPQSNATNRSIESLVAEYKAVRQATITLFESFTPAMCQRTGIASGKQLSVRALGYIIAGHTLHHQHIIRERYLVK